MSQAVKKTSRQSKPRPSSETLHVVGGKSFFQQVSQVINQCFWEIDLVQKRAQNISENFQKVWGTSSSILTQGDLTGFISSVHPDDQDRVLSEFHTKLGTEVNLEFRVIDEGTEIRWIWLRVFPMDHDSRLLLIADDVTEKKQVEENLRKREAELVELSRSLAVVDLASGVAHEINNPLTIIVGKCAELKRLAGSEKIDGEKVTALANKIQATSIRISDIVKSLKSLTRQTREGDFTLTSFSKLAIELNDLCSERFKDGGVSLDIASTSLSAEINPVLVSQLMFNLVSNAFDAIQAEKERWVKVEFEEDAQSVYISVTDSGPGIPLRIRGRIFDPFFTTKALGKGTGLGLSIASSVAHHHQGSIRVDHLCSHTKFVVQLPKTQKPK